MASLSGILDWFRAIYPQGMPPQDYSVVLGVLARRLSAGEVDQVARELAESGLVDADDQQIAQTIRQLMLTPPRGVDISRVGNHLELAQVIQQLENEFPEQR